jgi:energy-coupling factor transporter ATP-binding protein EcfA2
MDDDRILAAHEKAVGTAMSYLEEHAALRRREDGKITYHTTGRLLFARFTEHASRELDPHLHTHVVVLNMTNERDGASVASLETRAMFAEQMVAGQVYRNDLAHELRTLGYDVEFDPRRGLFEIVGIPGEFIAETSRRAAQIDAHAHEHGLAGQAARRQSFYETRRSKDKIGFGALRESWTARAAAYWPKLEAILVSARAHEVGERVADSATVRRATLFGLRQAESREAVNNLGTMYRLALASHVGEVRLADVRPLLAEHETKAKLLATREPTGDRILTRGRTTRETAKLEMALAQHLSLSLDDARPIASADRLLVALERASLTPRQEQALVQTALSRDRVTGIHGVAGSGKSTLIRTLAQAAEPGATVIGLAPTSSAAANLGQTAQIEHRTVASLLAIAGRGITDDHVLIVDEAGQLGNRQALRLLEISRSTGARVVFLGDNMQTGAIEQGKPFWLMQRLGLPTAELTESLRQETRSMKAAVTWARLGDYSASLGLLDKVVSGEGAAGLARDLVSEWTRLKPDNRANTNILVLDNATRLIVNAAVRETLKREGLIAADDTRFRVLTPAGLSDQEKHYARFYSGGQVVKFSQDNSRLGIARDTEYRIVGLGRLPSGRQILRLADAHGQIIRWDPRLGQTRHLNVFNREDREVAPGDRIQWRLVNKELDLKNAERGTVIAIDGTAATIRWDRAGRSQTIDLGKHKTWDHGYAETVYSSQSKTYARAYVLAPVNAGLVNGQNYYTAITRARYGIKLWTEDPDRLVEKLEQFSGEKTSALEALGRLNGNMPELLASGHAPHLDQLREQQRQERSERRDRSTERKLDKLQRQRRLPHIMAERAGSVAQILDRFLGRLIERGRSDQEQLRPKSMPSNEWAVSDHERNHAAER